MIPSVDPAATRVGAALFTDLVGFTAFTDAVGDSAAVGLLDRQTEIVGTVLSDTGGRLVKEIGDGLLIWFDTAERGLAGATRLMEAIETARGAGSFALAIRMGLHHGEAIQRGEDLVGQTINIASRVSDLAGPSELLVSEEVLAACRSGAGDISLSPIGPVTVKGVSEPIWLQRIELDGPSAEP